MEVLIGALIVAGLAYVFVRHYSKKTEDSSQTPAPYKVETPALPEPTPVPVEVKSETVTPVDNRWPFPASEKQEVAPEKTPEKIESKPKTSKKSGAKVTTAKKVAAPKEPKMKKDKPELTVVKSEKAKRTKK